MTKSKPENRETKVMNNSKSKAPELQILKRSEPNKQVLNLESGRRQGRTISDREHKENSTLLGLTQEDPQKYGYLRQT